MESYGLLIAIGLVGGFLAGWVGLGGGIILAPLLLFAPAAMGLTPFSMKEVSRLTIVQSLFASAAACVAYGCARQVHRGLVLWMGGSVAAASLVGAMFSESEIVSQGFVLTLFAVLALVAAALMIYCSAPQLDHEVAPDQVPFNRGTATSAGLGIGFLGGIIGQSGAFITIPLLIHVLRIPTRIAIASSLGITFFAALAGSVGKVIGGGPILWPQTAAMVAGTLVGSQAGAALGRHSPSQSLRVALAALIAISAARIWYQVLG
jgi:uncharacterized membrane protein YfcA